MSGSRRETEAERAKRKRKEADDKNSQTAESRAARANSRSANDDGLVEAAANSRRRVSQAGCPSPPASPVPKAATRKRLKGKGATLESSSDDEVAVAGAASAGKAKLMKGESLLLLECQ